MTNTLVVPVSDSPATRKTLTVTFLCPFCQTEVEGRGVVPCPRCHHYSQGTEVEDFDAALQEVKDKALAWEGLLDDLEVEDGEGIYNSRERLANALYTLGEAASGLQAAANRIRQRILR